jgi:hypothetical protein
MRLRTALVALLVLVGSACSTPLGRDIPECERVLTNSIIMQIQAVPSAALVPCINALEAGWSFNDVEPRSGLAEFSLDSDRIGEPFLTVRTTASCDLPSVSVSISDEGGAELFKDVVEDITVRIVVIPEGPSEATTDAAQRIIVDLFDARINDREVDASIDLSEGSTADRIRAAQATGSHVLIVSLRDAEEGTVSLLLAGETEEQSGLTRQMLDEVEATVSKPSYVGSWFYEFDGGCTEYRFDARGPGVETVAGDAQRSLGFTDAETVKNIARSAGYEIP